MAEGTNVGSIFLDLIVRDTIEKQVREITAKGQAAAQQAFSGMEKAAERSVNNAANTISKTTQVMISKVEGASKQINASLGSVFNKPVAIAQSKLNQLEKEAFDLSQKLEEAIKKDYSFKIYGYVSDDNALVSSLQAKLDKVHSKIEAAEERLAIEQQAAAQKAASAAEKIAEKQRVAAERAAASREKAAAREAAAAQKQAAAEERAAQKAVAAEEKAASRRKAITAAMWKNMLSQAGKATRRFGSRLREIVSGALIFNGLSLALRNVTQYIGKAVTSSDQMKTALANLKGAAATAAAPLLEALTPALVALTNAAATAFSYLSRLISFFTGKSLSSMANAAKKVQTSAGVAKKAVASLAGFDEIQRLDGAGDSSGGGSDSDSIEPNYDFQGTSPFLDSLTDAIKAGQWEQVGALIAQKLNSSLAAIPWDAIQKKVKTWTQNLVDTINGFVHNLNWGLLGSSIGNGLNTILTSIDTFFQGVDWVTMGSGIGTALNDMFATIDWAMLGRVLTDKFKALFELLHGFVTTFDFTSFGTNLATLFSSAFGNINWIQLAADIGAGIVGLFDAAIALVSNIDWVDFGAAVYDCLMAIDWSGMIDGLLELLASLAAGLVITLGTGLYQAFQDLGETISGYFTEVGENGIQGFLDGMLSLLCDIGMWLYDHLIQPVINGVKDALGIHSPSTVFAEIGENLIAGLLQGIESTWRSVSDFLVNAFRSVQKSVTEIWTKGIVPAIKGAINGIIGSINGMISGIASGINAVIRALNKLKFTIPDWVPTMGGKTFGFDIGYVSAPQIPMLADGGVITQPTLAMMGEYPSARNNPEIVAPQSIIAETVAAAMEDYAATNLAGQEAIVAVLREILEAVLGIEIGDDVIGQAVARYNRKMAIVRGGT